MSFVAGEPVDGFERVQIAAGVGEERRRQYGAESGQAEQDRRVTVLIEPLTDLLIGWAISVSMAAICPAS